MLEINKLHHGDCAVLMKQLPDNSVDTIITDPPYGLSFMGKKWDYDVPSIEIWKECLRVLKPGGTALIFAGSRTQHRMAINVEDAGFILKDCIMWFYSTGFPKATDISKQLDMMGEENKRYAELSKELCNYLKESREKLNLSQKDIAKHFLSKTEGLTGCVWNWENGANIPTMEQWNKLKIILQLKDEMFIVKIERAILKRIEAEREVIGEKSSGLSIGSGHTVGRFTDSRNTNGKVDITTPSTPEAKLWDGWKSHGLKPAYEPILVAMKPNEGSYAENALKHGVSGLNMDGGRIGNEKIKTQGGNKFTGDKIFGKYQNCEESDHLGRFPANIILDEEAAKMLDEQSGVSKSSGGSGNASMGALGKSKYGEYALNVKGDNMGWLGDVGGASRFFYTAKASKDERNRGCEELDEQNFGFSGGANEAIKQDQDEYLQDHIGLNKISKMKNIHPTVKPIKLMEYLCTLTKTPSGGLVLDPFAGSGSTLIAAYNTSRDFIGFEISEEYFGIAKVRIKKYMQQTKILDFFNN